MSEGSEGIVPAGVELACTVGVLIVKATGGEAKVDSVVGLGVERTVLEGGFTANVGPSDGGMPV